ncbi:MAG: hypothetical protein HYV63_32330 [Candidatus Schekmanbacteria bacterium]|nr:hypothetical protein [Candidatus Schekmanbacteria bacterium]
MARAAVIVGIMVVAFLGAGSAAFAVGQVTAEADSELGFADFRAQTGLTGSGVTVAVFANLYYNYEAAQASGDLPEVTFMYGAPVLQGNIGTRVIEIIHDIAPGAAIQIYDMINVKDVDSMLPGSWDGNAKIAVFTDNFEQNVWLDDDTEYANTISQIISQGSLVITSAGGHRLSYYLGTFKNAGNDLHDFGSGNTVWTVETTETCDVGASINWTDNYESYDYQNYGLYLLDKDMNVLSANDCCNGGPRTWAGVSSAPAGTYHFSVWKDPAAEVRDFGLVLAPCEVSDDAENGYPTLISAGRTANTIGGIAAIPGVLAVAALDRTVTTPHPAGRGQLFGVRETSAEGPARVLMSDPIERITPHVSATDCQSTYTAPGHQCGSWASAAVVAGAAALLQEHYQLARPSDLQDILSYSAADITSTGIGYDFRTGYGQINIWAAYRGENHVPTMAGPAGAGLACALSVFIYWRRARPLPYP